MGNEDKRPAPLTREDQAWWRERARAVDERLSPYARPGMTRDFTVEMLRWERAAAQKATDLYYDRITRGFRIHLPMSLALRPSQRRLARGVGLFTDAPPFTG